MAGEEETGRRESSGEGRRDRVVTGLPKQQTRSRWPHLPGPSSSVLATPPEAGGVAPPTPHTAQQLSQRFGDLPRSWANKSTGSSDCQIPETLKQHHGPEVPR